MLSCQYSFPCQLQLVSRHVIEVQEIGFKKFGMVAFIDQGEFEAMKMLSG